MLGLWLSYTRAERMSDVLAGRSRYPWRAADVFAELLDYRRANRTRAPSATPTGMSLLL